MASVILHVQYMLHVPAICGTGSNFQSVSNFMKSHIVTLAAFLMHFFMHSYISTDRKGLPNSEMDSARALFRSYAVTACKPQ